MDPRGGSVVWTEERAQRSEHVTREDGGYRPASRDAQRRRENEKVAFLAGHLAGKATFSPEQHPRRLDAGSSKSGSVFSRRIFKIFPGTALA
ncbi:hypothetical protein Ppa06_27800 [Planomonospora parontospora subsp. parontospora]|uniref:Uncharacterized protein n=2 Tax=Planomonospora parontospora TaxID=58119 RepID=A0AA37F4T9_9ACTN|nr:hypothetical protein GCM10010126_30370 [Planomonospora parontospora]GII08982.1 hypothetical protein Ppa06_27800 [Planomonospora parontospora subsp. parontospora]